MGTIEVIVAIGGLMILSGIAGGILAGFKNRDISLWIGWSFIIPPALLLLAFLPTIKGQRPRRPSLDEEDARVGDD